MAGLMNKVAERKQLKPAGDSDRDPPTFPTADPQAHLLSRKPALLLTPLLSFPQAEKLAN
jgi:hypothetical protein